MFMLLKFLLVPPSPEVPKQRHDSAKVHSEEPVSVSGFLQSIGEGHMQGVGVPPLHRQHWKSLYPAGVRVSPSPHREGWSSWYTPALPEAACSQGRVTNNRW